MGHGAGAGCCAVAGAAPGFLELSKTIIKMSRFKQSNARKRAARSTSKDFLAWLLLMIGIGGPSTYTYRVWYIPSGAGLFHQPHPCHEELPPWFLERQNISRRHPGHGHSGKLPCLVLYGFVF